MGRGMLVTLKSLHGWTGVGGDDGINSFWLRSNGIVLQILESEAESN